MSTCSLSQNFTKKFVQSQLLTKTLPPITCQDPGTGKSTLVNQIKKPLKDLNGCFIEGKFNKHAHPDSILGSALNLFFGNILEANKNEFMSMKWRIHDAIGNAGSNSVLLEILPNLKKWMADGSVATEQLPQSSYVKGIGSSHRLKFMFCKLIGAIASKSHPLVLFLDDLQWADELTVRSVQFTEPGSGRPQFLAGKFC